MATPAILKIQADVARDLPGLVKGQPTVYVRKIKNTNQPSQHSFGNAIDYYPTDAKQASDAQKGIKVESLERLYQYLQGHPLARVVCYYDRGGCTTNHRDHVHVDAKPKIRSQAHLEEVLAGSGLDDRAKREIDEANRQRGVDPDTGIYNPEDDPLASLNPLDGLMNAFETVGGFLELVTSAEFVKRTALVVGGAGVAAAGLYFIAKEFGGPTITDVAGAAVGGVGGAASKAAKGAS